MAEMSDYSSFDLKIQKLILATRPFKADSKSDLKWPKDQMTKDTCKSRVRWIQFCNFQYRVRNISSQVPENPGTYFLNIPETVPVESEENISWPTNSLRILYKWLFQGSPSINFFFSKRHACRYCFYEFSRNSSKYSSRYTLRIYSISCISWKKSPEIPWEFFRSVSRHFSTDSLGTDPRFCCQNFGQDFFREFILKLVKGFL